jgi:hypothetical protein
MDLWVTASSNEIDSINIFFLRTIPLKAFKHLLSLTQFCIEYNSHLGMKESLSLKTNL